MIEAYLQAHLRQYPKAEPRDLFKLCYQAARGAEHLLCDLEGARRYFFAEWEETEARDCPLCEPISDGFCRVDLGGWKAEGLDPEWLFRAFVRTAAAPTEKDPLADYLARADRAVAALPTAFSREEWETALAEYRAAGTPAVHHSETFRRAYRPAYRLVDRRLARLFPILAAVAEKRGEEPLTVAIDGGAASGKSTLAEGLSYILDAATVHMDDFFLPPALRTPERMREVGGNVDYERFLRQVIPHLRRAEAFSYGVFDCGVMAITGERRVEATPVRVVEGSYSHHPVFGDYAAIRVFSHVEPEEQGARILRRNGAAMAERFRTEWIPREEAYFNAFRIREKAHLTV